LQTAGDPPLAPALAADIKSAIDGMAVQRILDQLRAPMTPATAAARSKAVAMLRELLIVDGAKRGVVGSGILSSLAADSSREFAMGGTVTSDYMRLVVDCMSSSELVAMVNWEQVARNAAGTSW